MSMVKTKEEALKRFKKALKHKKEWEENFNTLYKGVDNLYANA